MNRIKTMALCLAFGGSLFTAQAQLKTPAPSPFQSVTQAFGLGEIKIEYSRPGIKGRVIYGGLVPYGKLWRTGANASTKVTFGDHITLAGQPVEAGTYALYTIPGKDEWQVMLYKDLTLGGNVAKYDAAKEALRLKIKPQPFPQKWETFTIAVNNITSTTCTIDLLWENTLVSIPVVSHHDQEVMDQIAEIMPDTADNRPYFSAAVYYYENDKDLNQALTWIDKAVAMNPDAFYMMHYKAKILVKMKDYKAAVEAANQSRAKAEEKQNADYVSLNDKLLAEIKKASGSK